MNASLIEISVRADRAGAVLQEVAALDPDERRKEAPSLAPFMGKEVQGLEDLWEQLRERLQGGVSPSDAADMGRILTRSANTIGSCLDLVVLGNPSLEEFRETNLARLRRIKAHAAALLRLAEMPPPVPDPERLRKSLEQMERGEGIDADNLLAELKG
jgi:hypothetical protein